MPFGSEVLEGHARWDGVVRRARRNLRLEIGEQAVRPQNADVEVCKVEVSEGCDGFDALRPDEPKVGEHRDGLHVRRDDGDGRDPTAK